MGDILARDARKESLNNLACFFVVRTAWAEGWSQSPQWLAWKVLSLERLERTTSWEPQRQNPALTRALGTLTFMAISGTELWSCVVGELSFFILPCHGLSCFTSFSSFVSVRHVSEVCGGAWNYHVNIPLLPLLCLSIENVSENIQQDISRVSVLSPTPEKTPLKEWKGTPVFFVKTLALWLSGS